MNIFSRRLLLGAFILILLTSACNALAGTPSTPIGTVFPNEQITAIVLPTNTSNLTATPFIPITGMDVVSLQCQFCVNDDAHAVLIMSSQATFNVSEATGGVNCLTAQEVNGRRILLCRGPQLATFNLNVCVGESNCLQFPIMLQTCPLIPQTGLGAGTPIVTLTPLTPIFLTPINTLIPPPTATPRPGDPTATSTGSIPTTSTTAPAPLPTSTTAPPPSTTAPPPPPTATSAPAPTSTEDATEPPPTEDPPTAEPTDDPPGGGNTRRPPTRTPRG